MDVLTLIKHIATSYSQTAVTFRQLEVHQIMLLICNRCHLIATSLYCVVFAR